MKNEIAAVDIDDLKTAWMLQRKLIGGSIDEEIYRRVCKPGVDVRAAAFRASALAFLVQVAPEGLEAFIHDGEPCELLFNAIAKIPITFGAPIQGSEFMEHIRRLQQIT